MNVETEATSPTRKPAADSQVEPGLPFAALRADLPQIRYLGLYDLPDLQCRWLYDFRSEEFVGATRQKSHKPLIAAQDLSRLEFQLTSGPDSLEYMLRLNGSLLTCLSERDKTNARLVESSLQRHGPGLLAMPAPSRKPRARTQAQSAKAPAAKASGNLSPAALKAALLALPDYEPIRALSPDPLLPSFKIRHKPSGELKVLKCLSCDPGPYAGVLAGIAAGMGGFEVPAFTGPLAGRSLMRPYLEGVSLKALLQKIRHLSVPQTIFIVIELCQALADAHAQGRAHLGLTPQNVLINRDKQLCLLDGRIGELHRPLLQQAAGESRTWLTENRYYLAPDYFDPSPSPAVDVFAMAALALHLLLGDEAFTRSLAGLERDRQPEVLQHLTDTLKESRYSILQATLQQMLAPRPSQRPHPRDVVSSLLAEARPDEPAAALQDATG